MPLSEATETQIRKWITTYSDDLYEGRCCKSPMDEALIELMKDRDLRLKQLDEAVSIAGRAAPASDDRAEFEAWVTGPPYEQDIARLPEDGAKTAWPGQYRLYGVQLAWEAWQQARRGHSND